MITRMNVKPSDVEFTDYLWGSDFNNCEKESIAGNVIRISQWNDDQWFDFSWEDYKRLCKHNVTEAERSYLDGFVEQGLLSFDGEKYSVNDAFIVKLWKFVKKTS